MELIGQTVKNNYINTNMCRVEPGAQNDDMYAFPMATSRWASHDLPWRNSQYFTPPNEASCATNQNPKSQRIQSCNSQNKSAPNERALSLNGSHCDPYENNRNAIFPFRKVIIASKLIMLPEKELHDIKLEATNVDHLRNTKHLQESTQQQRNINPQARNSFTQNHERPVTPPLGRSARLNEFIESRLQSGGIKGFPTQKCLNLYSAENENHQKHPEIENRIKNLNDKTTYHSTPMSLFKNDQRLLMNAIRAYKRDAELQKERCQYSNQNTISDICNMDWYNHMMSIPGPASLDPQTELTLLRSDLTRLHDSLGGCNYLGPKIVEGSYRKRQERACNHSTTVDRQLPKVKNLFERAAEDNLRAIREEINERDRLLTTFVILEQEIHGARNRYYDTQGNKHSRGLAREICDAENYKRNILSDISSKERNLGKMMEQQRQLESELIRLKGV